MKKLADGNEVSSRSYYYLLDWNDSNGWTFLLETFGEMSLSKLNIEEYKKLFKYATESELKTLTIEN